VRHRALWLLLIMMAASAVVACSGGAVNTTPAGPTPAPTLVPTTYPTTGPNGQPTTAPTTVPTTVPTNTPNSTLKLSPSSLALNGVGTAYQLTLTATQSTPTQLTASGCTAVANATIGPIGASTTITVLGTAAGSCSLTIADATGQKVVVPVSVMLPAVAAYCSNYASLSGVALNLTDDAGLAGATLIVYITNGTSFMDNAGNFTQSQPYPLPAACYSNTVGSSATGRTLAVPNGLSAGRIYLAYATPAPSNAVPNPFAGANISGPTVGYSANPFPWDVIEYGTTSGAVIDTTQVNALGLPLELSVTGGALPSAKVRRTGQAYPAPCATNPPATIVGVTSCNFGLIFQAMAQVPNYSSLVVAQNFNGQLLDLQIVSPNGSVSRTSFQWNLFALSSYIPAPTPSICPAGTPANGYLTCVLNAYNTSLAGARLFQTSGIGASNVSGDNYCATSDGSANFTFTDVGTVTSCASATPKTGVPVNPFHMPIQEFTYGMAPGNSGCTQAILFSQPWGNAQVGANQIFGTADAFALWKGVSADLNRGTMLTTSMTHPVGVTNPSMNIFFQDPLFNTYAQIVHTYFNGNLAYALAYDDLGNFESGLTWQPGNPINVRINQIPTAATGSSVPSPVPVPSTCPALPINVGTF
jgi:hypothetical protein